MRTITASTLRRTLGRVLDEVTATDEPVAITRGRRGPVAVLVSQAWYDRGSVLAGTAPGLDAANAPLPPPD